MERVERRVAVARQPVVVQLGLVGRDQSHDALSAAGNDRTRGRCNTAATSTLSPGADARLSAAPKYRSVRLYICGDAALSARRRSRRRYFFVPVESRFVMCTESALTFGSDVAFPLVRRLARRDDVHLEMRDGAVVGQANRGVPTTDAREAVDFVAHDLVAAARDALDGDGIVAEEREEAVLLGGLLGPQAESARTTRIGSRFILDHLGGDV